MKLYCPKRVYKIEQTDDWKEWREKSKVRRAKAKERAREQKQAKVDEVLPEILVQARNALETFKTADELKQAAVEGWQKQQHAFQEAYPHLDVRIGKAEPSEIDDDTMTRWICNLIRHRETDYDYILQENAGKVGEAHSSIRKLVKEWLASH